MISESTLDESLVSKLKHQRSVLLCINLQFYLMLHIDVDWIKDFEYLDMKPCKDFCLNKFCRRLTAIYFIQKYKANFYQLRMD